MQVEQWIAVREQHHRHRQSIAQTTQHGEHIGGSGVLLEGPISRRLNHRPVGQWIAVRNAQFNNTQQYLSFLKEQGNTKSYAREALIFFLQLQTKRMRESQKYAEARQ